MTVYADVLIAINIFVNYFLLLCVKGITKNDAKKYSLLFGALLGGIYSLVIFLPEIPATLTFMMNMIASLAIVIIAFKPKKAKTLIKIFFTFFGVSIAFAGCMLLIWLTLKPDGMVYNNSVVYFDIDIKVLIFSTIICYFVVMLIFKLSRRAAPDNKIYSVTLTNADKAVTVNALLDTGNNLHDCFTGKPVIIVQESVIKKLFCREYIDFFKNGNIPENENGKRLRLIPVNTVAEKGMLKASAIDSICINDKNITVNDVIIAQSKNDFCTDEYSVLLNNDIINEG